MRKVFLLLTFFISFYSEAISQQKDFGEAEKPQEVFLEKDPVSRYQIGINTQFVIDGILDQSIRTPIEMLIRRQDGHGRAFRVRVSGIIQNSRRFELEYLNEIRQSDLGLAIGYEWQQNISKKWFWSYGLEVEGSKFWYNKIEEYSAFNQYTEENFHVKTVDDQKTYRLSLLPLIGFKYQITPRLFVNTEFKLEAFTEKLNSRKGYDLKTIYRSQEYDEASFEEFSMKDKKLNFQPFTGIFINFIL